MGSRRSIRVLVFDEADRVLLVRVWDADRSWWCTPGGGVEPGETEEGTARRERREEVGETSIELGPCIWTRRHIGVFRGGLFDQSERIYLDRVAAFEPRPATQALLEHGPDDVRWWMIDELDATSEEFAPRRLPELVRDLMLDGPPAAPVDIGV